MKNIKLKNLLNEGEWDTIITYSQTSDISNRNTFTEKYREDNVNQFLEYFKDFVRADTLPNWLVKAYTSITHSNNTSKSYKVVQDILKLSLSKKLNIKAHQTSENKWNVTINGKPMSSF